LAEGAAYVKTVANKFILFFFPPDR
jgi:hypothetical protein